MLGKETKMTTTEEARPLLQGRPAAGAAEGCPTTAVVGKDRKGATLKGAVVTALAALAVYLAAATASRTVLWEESSLSAEKAVDYDGGDSPDDSPLEAGGDDSLLSGLINPNNGTHLTQTTTEDCTADTSLPVLGGVDVVAYWALPEGSVSVLGTADLVGLFRDYRFFFSSIENLRTFERDPVKYLPAFGGFCSYGVAAETVWTVDTLGPFGDHSQWKIVDGQLYIFRSRVPKTKWSLAQAEFIEAGNAIWNSWFPAQEGPAPLNTACLCSEEFCADA